MHSLFLIQKVMLDALIVGAGPTGLTLACELIKRGLSVRLVEQLATPIDQSRALAIHSRTLEVFEKMGILDRFLREGKQVTQGNIYYNRKRVGGFNFSHLIAPHPYVLCIPQPKTEEILTHYFEELGGTIERSVTLKSVSQTQAVLAHANQTEELVSARWIFGCDGAHSSVRRCLNLPFKGAKFSEGFGLADVEMQSPLDSDQVHAFFLPNTGGALLPLPEKNWVRIIVLNLNQNQPLTLPFLQTLFNALSPTPIKLKQISWMSVFFVQRRIVPRMRSENIFLLGDAAHIHSPFGAQGLNTSVQDAFNLAWKIALVHQGLAKETLLESYDQERHPVAKDVLRNTTIGTQIISSKWLKRLFIPLIGWLSKSAAFQRRLTSQVAELDIAYRNSPIVSQPRLDRSWEGPQPGERAPDILLENHQRLFSLFCHPEHTLLCFGDVGFEPLLDRIRKDFSQTIRIEQLPIGQPNIYCASPPCFYLIRPDGIIAYRSRSLDPAPFVEYLSKVFA
jgi:2-polyprenyl-6-methoxyphenol hydroxylase-like FAD-dependent oxidoreductase